MAYKRLAIRRLRHTRERTDVACRLAGFIRETGRTGGLLSSMIFDCLYDKNDTRPNPRCADMRLSLGPQSLLLRTDEVIQ